MQATSVARGFNLPAMTLAHLARIPTHSYLNAPLSNKQQQWPVLLFSHGFGIGYESQNTVQMEELASHGYVIVSIDHTYEAGVVVFPDGQVAYGGAPVAPDSASIARLTELVKGLATLTDTTQLKALANDMRATMKLDPSMTRWLADTRFILDQLPTALAEWAPRLQLDRVGLFGMSFGGATAESFCTIDPRCAAGVNLDGLSFGPSTEQAMPRPFLFATSGTNTHMYDVPYLRALAPVTRMGVANSLHLDYTDVGFFSPLFVRLGALGGIPAREMHRIMNTALLTWFNHHLHGAALDWTPLRAFPQVTLDQRSP
jgi:pimeloyl-ACP methyl ester carboxylesterase